MTYYVGSLPVSDSLEHFGIKGMKWGVRRFENKDGSLTEAGKKRYRKYQLKNVDPKIAKNKTTRQVASDYHNLSDNDFMRKYKVSRKTFAKRYRKSDGDTYSMGKKRAARAKKFNDTVAKTGFNPEKYGRKRVDKLVKNVRKHQARKANRSEKLKAMEYKPYGKGNLPGQGVYRHYKEAAEYYKDANKKNKNLRGKARIKANFNTWLDQPMTLSGLTGTGKTTRRKRLKGQSYEWY